MEKEFVEFNDLALACFIEFCALAGDSPCGCDACPYVYYRNDENGCYDEYVKHKRASIATIKKRKSKYKP